MSVATTHRDYDKFFPKWKRARDCVAGQDAVRKAGEEYLAKLKDETPEDYRARLSRSDFYNGSWRTIDGMRGMAFRKPPVVDAPAGLATYTKDVTLSGIALDNFASEIVEEVLSVGRVGILVDHPPMPEVVTPLTVEAAQRLGLRPTMQLYATESIINWRYARIDNAWSLALVVLKEVEAVQDDEFKVEYEDRYRVLDLTPSGYRQRLFRIGKNGKDEQIGSDIYPLMNGSPLPYIPFAIIGSGGRGDVIDEPPLIDLIDANLALYQINADYRHGLHFTGLPTAVVSGYQPENQSEKLYIGSQAAWVFPDPNAKAVYLEFTGQGLTELREAIKEKKQDMAMLGARMIADETRQAETLGATQIKRAGENSILAAIVTAVSNGLEWALGIFAQWAGQSGTVGYQINRDFNPMMLDAQTLTAIFAGVQGGHISEAEAFELMQRGDVIDSKKTLAEHQAEVESQGPTRPPAPAPAEAA